MQVPELKTNPNPFAEDFTESDIRKLQQDDAMAAGMIGVILSLAFVVLLSITIGVNIWMLHGG